MYTCVGKVNGYVCTHTHNDEGLECDTSIIQKPIILNSYNSSL